MLHSILMLYRTMLEMGYRMYTDSPVRLDEISKDSMMRMAKTYWWLYAPVLILIEMGNREYGMIVFSLVVSRLIVVINPSFAALMLSCSILALPLINLASISFQEVALGLALIHFIVICRCFYMSLQWSKNHNK